MLQNSFILAITLACAAVTAVPLTRRQSPSLPANYCMKPRIQKAYNLGADFYLAIRSSQILRFDAAERQIDNHTFTSNSKLFGNALHSVESVVSLEGFCRKSPLCVDSSWKEIEKLVIVVGIRQGAGLGYSLFKFENDERSLKMLNTENADANMSEKIKKLGIGLQAPIPTEDSISMFDGFWTKENPDYSYQSGVFVPSRGEMLFNVFEDRKSHETGPQMLLRKKFTTTQNNEWSSVALSSLGDFGKDFKGFKGMITFDDRVYGVGAKDEMFEIEWNADDSLTVKPSTSMREFIKCPQESTTTITTTTSLPTTQFSSSSTAAPTVVSASSAQSSTTQEAERNVNKVAEDDAEIFTGKSDTKENQSGELKELDNEESNRIDNDDLPHQSDDPNSHSTPASKFAPDHSIAGPTEDGIVWTVAVVVLVVLMLTILILIPIIIIRNKGTTKNHKVTNANGAKDSKVGANNDENVKLMNAGRDTDV